jgi:hypothetical protein
MPPRHPKGQKQGDRIGGLTITQDPAYMPGSPARSVQQARMNYPGKARSKMAAQEAFEASFQKPGADRTPIHKDSLYFKDGAQNEQPMRNRSSHIPYKNQGPIRGNSLLTGGYDDAPQHRGGRRAVNSNASTSNLIIGGYGQDAMTELEKNFKPYSNKINRNSLIY